MSEFDDEDLGEEPVVINTVTAKKVNYLNIPAFENLI